MGEKMSARTLALGAAVVAWVSWCVVSAGAVALIVRLAATVLARPALMSDTLVAVVVEALLLGATAFVEFRVLMRFEPPSRFWIAAPAGYLASFLVYVVLARVLGDASTSITAGTALELVAVSAVVGAGAYMAGIERPRAAAAASDAED